MDVDTFREGLDELERMMLARPDKEVYMYCTGGIRCTATSSYFANKGIGKNLKMASKRRRRRRRRRKWAVTKVILTTSTIETTAQGRDHSLWTIYTTKSKGAIIVSREELYV